MDATTTLLPLNDQLLKTFERVINGLTTEQIHYVAPAIDGRPLCDVALHAYRSLHGFVAQVMGHSLPQEKGRTNLPARAGAAKLLATLHAEHDAVEAELRTLDDAALSQMLTLPWGAKESGLGLVALAFGHSFTHAGHINGIRAMGGFPTPAEG